MAERPYSESFIRTTFTGGYTYWTVPPGKRAVVTSVSLSSVQSVAVDSRVDVGGVAIFYVAFPARPTTETWEGRAVAYHGEQIRVYQTAGICYAHVGGYLLEDLVGGPPLGAGSGAVAFDELLNPLPADV